MVEQRPTALAQVLSVSLVTRCALIWARASRSSQLSSCLSRPLWLSCCGSFPVPQTTMIYVHLVPRSGMSGLWKMAPSVPFMAVNGVAGRDLVNSVKTTASTKSRKPSTCSRRAQTVVVLWSLLGTLQSLLTWLCCPVMHCSNSTLMK